MNFFCQHLLFFLIQLRTKATDAMVLQNLPLFAHSQVMEMRECKLFLGNVSVCDQLSGKEKAGKLECSKNIR